LSQLITLMKIGICRIESSSKYYNLTLLFYVMFTSTLSYVMFTSYYNLDSLCLYFKFIYVFAPHTAEAIGDYLSKCLFEWNIDRKLSTLTIDNCSNNDALIDYMINKIGLVSFVLNGELFHMHCCAHILNLIVKDGMQSYETVHHSKQKTQVQSY